MPPATVTEMTTARPARPARVPSGSRLARDVALHSTLGSRRRRKALLYWFVARRFGQWCHDSPKKAGLLAAVALLFGWLQDLGLVLGIVTGTGWLILAWERSAKDADCERIFPPWRPAEGMRPWHKPLGAFWRGFLDRRRCLLSAFASVFISLWLPLTGPGGAFVASLLAIGNVALIIKLRVPPEKRTRWHEEGPLVAMFCDEEVGLLKVRPNRPLPMLSRRGKHWSDAEGEHIRIEMPGGTTWRSVAAKTEAMASYWSMPAELVRVTYKQGDPAGALTLSRLVPRPPSSTVGGLSWVCTAKVTDATQPYRVGEDEDTGETLLMENEEVNDLTAGIPGSGKTEFERIDLATYLLDPRARGFGLDGKGSRKDYGLVAPLFEEWIWGTDEDAPTRLLAMLEKVLAIVRRRNTIDDGHQDWDPVIVWLEELQDVLSGATKEEYDAIVMTLGRIVRMGRAVRVKVKVITQRTSVEDLPSKIRNLLAQRVAFRVLVPADFALVLAVQGKLPVRMPTQKVGQGVLRLPSGVHALVPDRVPLEEWRRICARSPWKGRSPSGETMLADLDDRVPTAVMPVEATPEASADDLIDEVLAVLRESGPLQASTLLARLPDHVRPPTDRDLGVALRAYPQVERKRFKGNWAWWPVTVETTLATSRRTLVDERSAPSYEGPIEAEHAQEGAREGLTLVAGGLP